MTSKCHKLNKRKVNPQTKYVYKTDSLLKGYRFVRTVGRLHCKTKSNRKIARWMQVLTKYWVVFIKIYCTNCKHFSETTSSFRSHQLAGEKYNSYFTDLFLFYNFQIKRTYSCNPKWWVDLVAKIQVSICQAASSAASTPDYSIL